MTNETNNKTTSQQRQHSTVSGVIFARSRGCTFSTLSLVVVDENNNEAHTDNNPVVQAKHKQSIPSTSSKVVLVRIQFPNAELEEQEDEVIDENNKELRSFCRRTYKIGDRLDVRHPTSDDAITSVNVDEDTEEQTNTSSRTNTKDIIMKASNDECQQKIIIDCQSIESIKEHVQIRESRVWDMKECQQIKYRFFGSHSTHNIKKKREKEKQTSSSSSRKRNDKKKDTGIEIKNKKDNGHGAGYLKRIQGEHLAKFLVEMIVQKLQILEGKPMQSIPSDSSSSPVIDPPSSLPVEDAADMYWRRKAIQYLNSGGGVVDVAGGSGHVSMALGMIGVKSTVVDARERVGMLPGRDRKIYNRALKTNGKNTRNGQENNVAHGTENNLPTTASEDTLPMYCQPVIPYQTYRSWFGYRPEGVDSSFRHPDQEEIPTCDEHSTLLRHASAIVALHPDEATGEVVRIAIHRRIPFVIVPCCVFARLFPNRRLIRSNNNQRDVSTYEDLLEYLLEQDSSIKQSILPFDGKNIALWSIFDDI